MILITFTFLGNDVKMEYEGEKPIDKTLLGSEKLQEIKKFHEFMFRKEEERYKDTYSWCKANCTGTHEIGRRRKLFWF